MAMVSRSDAAVFLETAVDNLAAAESEYGLRRYDSCANRCYYACFQAAIAALLRAGVRTSNPEGQWGHGVVQAQFSLLIDRRKLYPSSLRDTLSRLELLRERADYQAVHVSESQASQTLRRARTLVQAVQEG